MGCHQCAHIKETEIKEITNPIEKQESVVAFDDLKLANEKLKYSNEEKKQIEIIYHQEIKKSNSLKKKIGDGDDGKNIDSGQNQEKKLNIIENDENRTLNLPNFPSLRKNEKKLNANLIMAEDVKIESNFCKKESEDLIDEEVALDENGDFNFQHQKASEDHDEFGNF